MGKIYALIETDGYEDYVTYYFKSKEDATLVKKFLEEDTDGTTYYVIFAENLYDSINDFKEKHQC